MSGFNWPQWLSRIVGKPNCPRSRYARRNTSNSSAESLEPRTLLSGSSLTGKIAHIEVSTKETPADETATETTADTPIEEVATEDDAPAEGAANDDTEAQENAVDEILDKSQPEDTDSEDTGDESGESDSETITLRTLETASDDGESTDDPPADESDSEEDSDSVIYYSMGAPQESQQFTFSLAEYSSTSTLVGTVTSTDPDTNASVNYTIISGNEDGVFAIDSTTGAITVADGALLDFESNPSRSFTIDVTDNTDPSFSGIADVTVNLTNVNEAPLLADTTLSVAENSPDATTVGDVFASDPDIGSALQFSIIAGNAAGAFAINAYTGQVTVANGSLLNFETRPVYNMTVQITDNATPGLTATAQLTIQLTDVDDPPVVAFSSTIAKYRVGDGAVRFGTKALVSDEDSPNPSFDGMVLSASVSSGRSNKDVLSVKDTGSKSKKIVTHGNNIIYGKTIIGTVEGGRGDDPELRITLNSFATKTAVEALLRALSFSTKDTSTTTRTLDVQFSSSTGTVLSTTARSVPIKKKIVEKSSLPGWGFF